MTRKVAIVGSKSLASYDPVYRMIDSVIEQELQDHGTFVLTNGGEEGVDLMAAELALTHDVPYDPVPLEKCAHGCRQNSEYCFEHSYKPRSFAIAKSAEKIYRIYDESCSTSTCEVTAGFGEELGKQVKRIPIDVLMLER